MRAADVAPGEPLGWALIGASSIASTYVIGAIRAADGHDPIGVLSSDPSRGASYARANGLKVAYRDAEELWSDARVSAVYVSTGNANHVSDVLRAAQSGRHVLCEKPLGIDTKSARSAVALCHELGVVLAVNHHLRAGSAQRAAAALVQRGELGQLLSAHVFHGTALPEQLRTWRLQAPAYGGGLAHDLTSHGIDLVRFLTGQEIVSVYAMTSNHDRLMGDAETSLTCLARLERGALVTLEATFALSHERTHVDLRGTEGDLTISEGLGDEPGATVTVDDARGRHLLETQPIDSLYAETIRAFTRAVHGKGEPICTGEDGIRAVEVVQAVIASTDSGRAVEVPA